MTTILNGIITIMVADMEAAIEFYTGTLGFTLKKRYDDHWADIEGPGLNIGLHPASPETVKGDALQIGLSVPDLRQAMTDLEKKGVKFSPVQDDNVRLAYFHDPDNNQLYLVQAGW